MGFTVLEWFVQESWKFDLFMDTKTLIAPVKLKSESLVLQYCLIAPIKLKSTSFVLKFCLFIDISFYGLAKGTK